MFLLKSSLFDPFRNALISGNKMLTLPEMWNLQYNAFKEQE